MAFPVRPWHCRCMIVRSRELSILVARVRDGDHTAHIAGGDIAMANYIYLVQMDIPAELEDEFNRIYDTEHVPNIVKAPGVYGCTRYRLESTNAPGMARY